MQNHVPPLLAHVPHSVWPARDCLSSCGPPVAGDCVQHVTRAPLPAVAPDHLSVSTGLASADNMHQNLTLVNSLSAVSKTKLKVLLLCTGPDSRHNALFTLFSKAGVGGESFDVVNGPQFDLTDDATLGSPRSTRPVGRICGRIRVSALHHLL